MYKIFLKYIKKELFDQVKKLKINYFNMLNTLRRLAVPLTVTLYDLPLILAESSFNRRHLIKTFVHQLADWIRLVKETITMHN